MKKIFCLISLVFLYTSNLISQEISIPPNYSVVASQQGDLDKDGIDELVVAYNTRVDIGEEGVPRELILYKSEKGAWTEWKKSHQALFDSRDGGLMGDPFSELAIKKGILWISHYGGSSWKWEFIDKYRFQEGEFYLPKIRTRDLHSH